MGVFDLIRDYLWHYLLCFLLLIVCFVVFRRLNFTACAVCTGLMTLISILGFFVVYSGPFAASGKTLLGYAVDYGPVALPVFLFPILGLILTLACRKKKTA